MIVILCVNNLFYYSYNMARCRQAPYKMASEIGLEPLQISTCYKMAGLLKVLSYKMTLEIGLEASHFVGEISPGMLDMIWLPQSGFEEFNQKSNKYSGKAGVLSGGYATDITSSQSKRQRVSSCFIVFWIGQKH